MVILILIVIASLGLALLLEFGYLATKAEIHQREAEEKLRLYKTSHSGSNGSSVDSGSSEPTSIPYQMDGKTYYAKPGDPIYEKLLEAMKGENA